jgi:hypothetical protein
MFMAKTSVLILRRQVLGQQVLGQQVLGQQVLGQQVSGAGNFLFGNRYKIVEEQLLAPA